MNMKYTLNQILTLYSEKNTENLYEPVSVGKYGIRKRSEIYKKELADDYSKNKLIYKDTLTIGLGSKQIDFGILKEDIIYSVSPAYSTFKINNKIVFSEYLELFFFANNDVLTKKYMIASARQGKKVDIANMLNESIDVPNFEEQANIIRNISIIYSAQSKDKKLLDLFDELVKSRFVEMFGDPESNSKNYVKKKLKETCNIVTGNTPSRSVSEYYGDYIEWIKTDNILTDVFNPTTAAEYLSEKGMKVGKTVKKGAILMACIAGSVTSIGKVCITDRMVAFNQQINAIIPKEYNVFFLYVMFRLSKEYLVKDINMTLKGIISKSKLEEKSFIVPLMKYQEQFGEFVEQTEKSKVEIQKRMKLYTELIHKKMNEYFG